MPSVLISAKSARLRFVLCGPPCIALGCTAKCCDAPTRPDGCLVSVLPSEAKRLAKVYGASAEAGLLRPREGERRCPFKSSNHLCALHGTPDKPMGCTVSPFVLNGRDTLIIRNRYKLLPCATYARAGHPADHAYRVFRSSLERIFGIREAADICQHLDRGGGDYRATMRKQTYAALKALERVKHATA